MKAKYLLSGIGMLLFMQSDVHYPSQLQARYSLLQDELNIEIGSEDEFDAYRYLLRNRHPIKEEEKQKFPIEGEVDVETLGTYQVAFNHTYKMQVTIQDTTAPNLQLQPLQVKRDEQFTWDEEAYASIIQQMNDNYTDQETLKQSFSCEDIDTSSAGEKQITCRVKDENGNEAIGKLAVSIVSPTPTPSNATTNNVMGSMTTAITIPPAAYTGDQMAQIQEVASLVNSIRSEHGLSLLSLDMGNYHNVTYQRSLEIAQAYSHTRPNGQPCYTIFTDYGVGFHSAGENIGQGQQSAQEVVNDWMNSPTHRENILRPEFRILSAGVLGEGAQKVWIQTFFS